MKKYLILSLLAISATMLCGQNRYTIDGQISNIKDGTYVELRAGADNVVIDSDTISGGRFSLSGAAAKAQPVQLYVYRDGNPLSSRDIWIAPGSATGITGNSFATEVWNVQNDVPQQAELNRYVDAARDQLAGLQEVIAELSEKYHIIMTGGIPNNEMDNVKRQFDLARESMLIITDSIFARELPVMREYRNTDILMDKLLVYSTMFSKTGNYKNVKELRELLANLPDSVKNLPQAKQAGQILTPFAQSIVGRKAIDQPMTGIDGNKHTLAQYRGKYVLVDFWASWCQPCMLAIPEVREAAQKFDGRLTVVGINLDARDMDWRQASNRHNITWVDLHDADGFKSGLHMQYQGRGIPYYVLISPEGIVLDVWSGYRQGDLVKRIEAFID